METKEDIQALAEILRLNTSLHINYCNASAKNLLSTGRVLVAPECDAEHQAVCIIVPNPPVEMERYDADEVQPGEYFFHRGAWYKSNTHIQSFLHGVPAKSPLRPLIRVLPGEGGPGRFEGWSEQCDIDSYHINMVQAFSDNDADVPCYWDSNAKRIRDARLDENGKVRWKL